MAEEGKRRISVGVSQGIGQIIGKKIPVKFSTQEHEKCWSKWISMASVHLLCSALLSQFCHRRSKTPIKELSTFISDTCVHYTDERSQHIKSNRIDYLQNLLIPI